MLGVGKVLDMVRGRGGDGETAVYEFRSQQDPELKETFEKMKKTQTGLMEMNEFLRGALDIQPDQGRSFVARCLALITPRWMYPRMPAQLLKLMAEEADALHLIHGLYRERINNHQEALRNCAKIGIKKQDDHEKLIGDLQKAKDENWNAQKLQDHMSAKAGIEVFDEVKKLLDDNFKLLSPEEKEARKQHLMLQITNNVRGSDSLMKLIAKVLASGISVFNTFTAEFFAYVQFYEPMAVIRDSAEVMTESNQVMYAGREALLATAQKAVDAIIVALEAKAHIARYSIASPEMEAALESEMNRLEATIAEVKIIEAAALEDGQKQLALEEGKNTARQLTDGGNAIDAEIVGEPRLATGGFSGKG